MDSKIIIAIFTFIGGVIGWCLKLWHQKATIDHLNAEKMKFIQDEIKCAGDNLERRQEKRRAYNNSCEECKQEALLLIKKIDDNDNSLKETRESLCTILFNKVIPSYIELIEWEHLLYRDNPDKIRTLIAEDVIVELRRYIVWIRSININVFTHKMKLSPAKVNKRTLNPFLLLINDFPKKENDTIACLLKTTINDLISEGG